MLKYMLFTSISLTRRFEATNNIMLNNMFNCYELRSQLNMVDLDLNKTVLSLI